MLKTWEVYKIALENPRAKFKRLAQDCICYMDNDKGQLQILGTAKSWPVPRVDEDWELVPEEVTWQEAIQVWMEGKTIYCSTSTGCCVFEGKSDYYQALLDGNKWSLNKEKLLHATWFIEN